MPKFILLTIVFVSWIGVCGQKKKAPPYKLPVLPRDMDQRLKMIEKAVFNEPNFDPRCGEGYTGPELFELHKRLRFLVQKHLHQAPSREELSLLKKIIYGRPDREITPRRVMNIIRKRRKKGNVDNLFYDGYTVNRLMTAYRATGDRRYLDNAVVMADFIMGNYEQRLSDPKQFQTWARHHDWLGLGRGYAGICELILAIVVEPNLHNATAVDGDQKNSPMTYIERAQRWLPELKKLIDFRQATDHYDNGKYYETEKEVNYKGGPAATNRYLYYTHFLCAAASAAEALAPERYEKWIKTQRQRVREITGWFQKSYCRPEELNKSWWQKDLIDHWDPKRQVYTSPYGPYIVWAYKPGRQSTEDYIHLYMDMEAFDDIFRHHPTIIPESFLRMMAVAFMISTYDYKTGYIPFNLGARSGRCNPLTQKPWHTYFCPIYGKYIGRFINDEGFNKFINRCLLIWDDQLIKGRIGRFSQYPMPREIVWARYYRYQPNASWPIPDEVIPLPPPKPSPAQVPQPKVDVLQVKHEAGGCMASPVSGTKTPIGMMTGLFVASLLLMGIRCTGKARAGLSSALEGTKRK